MKGVGGRKSNIQLRLTSPRVVSGPWNAQTDAADATSGTWNGDETVTVWEKCNDHDRCLKLARLHFFHTAEVLCNE